MKLYLANILNSGNEVIVAIPEQLNPTKNDKFLLIRGKNIYSTRTCIVSGPLMYRDPVPEIYGVCTVKIGSNIKDYDSAKSYVYDDLLELDIYRIDPKDSYKQLICDKIIPNVNLYRINTKHDFDVAYNDIIVVNDIAYVIHTDSDCEVFDPLLIDLDNSEYIHIPNYVIQYGLELLGDTRNYISFVNDISEGILWNFIKLN